MVLHGLACACSCHVNTCQYNKIPIQTIGGMNHSFHVQAFAIGSIVVWSLEFGIKYIHFWPKSKKQSANANECYFITSLYVLVNRYSCRHDRRCLPAPHSGRRGVWRHGVLARAPVCSLRCRGVWRAVRAGPLRK